MKIYLEISEITEVKVGNHHLEIDILLLQSQKNNFGVTGKDYVD